MEKLPSAVCTGHVHENSYTLSDVDLKGVPRRTSPFRPDHPLSRPENVGTAFTSMVASQSLFLGPRLIEGLYHEDIGNKPIPVMCNRDTATNLGWGSGGRTYEARICKDHFHFPPLLQPTGLWCQKFALKISKSPEEYKRERDFLELLVTTFCYGFEVDNSAYLLAELADSNMDSFMETNPKGREETGLERQWLLSQLRGLAGALAAIHRLVGPDLTSPHHHDIKPSNILGFNSTATNSKPIFKLTDWACVGWKPETTRDSITPTLSPESHDNGTSSQPHDIWSLGCIFLDLMIWHRKVWHILKGYRSRVYTDSSAGCYYNVKDGEKTRTRGVATTLNRNKMYKTEEVVRLIGDMLEIEPGERPRASSVVNQLVMLESRDLYDPA
jgi:serine/threonine protein kinase